MRGRLALVCALLAAACTSAARAETSALASAVDRWRRSEGPGKDTAGRAVGAVACSERQVCEARQACVAAIEPTSRALALTDEVTARMIEIEAMRLAPNSPEASALPDKLDEAKRLLEEGRAHMADCDAKLAALQLAFGG